MASWICICHLDPTLQCRAISQQPRSPADAFLKLLRDLIPDNIVAAATDMNLLGIIFFSVGFGIALSLTRHDDNCQQIMRSVVALNQVIIKMVRYAAGSLFQLPCLTLFMPI